MPSWRARHRAFVRAADAYGRTLRTWPDERMLGGARTRPTWEELPPLAYAPPGVTARAYLGGLLALLGAIALAAALAWLAFRRYDLRPHGA